MQAVVTQENFSKGMQLVSRVATTRSSLPILANILLATEKGQLKLAATDLELGVTTWVGAKVDDEGTMTLPARLLVDFVANNPDTTLTITTAGTEATITSDRHTAVLKGMDSSEFPLIPPPGKAVIAAVSSATLKQALGDVLYAAAIDDARPVLAGVSFVVKDGLLTLAATDSYRLAERQIALAAPSGKKEKAAAMASTNVALILPARAVAELVRILPDRDERVEIGQSANQLSFVLDGLQVVSRLIEGTFPDYAQIIPKEATTTLTASRAELIAGVKMADLFARDAAHHVRLAIAPGGEQQGLTILAASSSAGENTARVTGEVTGDAITMAFNAKYLLDALNVLHAEQVRIECSGVDRPGIFRPVGDSDYLSLVMPLRLEA